MTIWKMAPDGGKKEVDFPELNSIKKDVLFFFDWSRDEIGLTNAFVERDTLDKDYWEYLSINSDDGFFDEDVTFVKRGCLIIIIGMVLEFLDEEAGNQGVFQNTSLDKIMQYLELFSPIDSDEAKLLDIAKLGMNLIIDKEVYLEDGAYQKYI